MTARTLAEGRYVLSEQPLGVGGMGTVWKAFDTVLHREVAVKEVRFPPGLNPAEHQKLQDRALREARAAAGLNDPGIVTIHDVVTEDGRPWIVMRLLPGESLAQRVGSRGPLSPRRTAELGLRLLAALTTAHANGVLHRDVKPHNVMLDGDDRWMLTDFGIASVAGATGTLTGTGIVTGTLGYVAPERLSGAQPGPAADLWSLGATLYYAVEGRPAFDHDDLPAMLAAVLTRDPAPPRHAGQLAPIIAGLMTKDPSKRLDAATARSQLAAVADGYPTFENATASLSAADRPTERLGGSTKRLPTEAAEQPPASGDRKHLSTLLTWFSAVRAWAVGAFLVLVGYSLYDEMPFWMLLVIALPLSLGHAAGTALAPRLVRRLGPTGALIGSSLWLGESLIGTGALMVSWEPPRAFVPLVLTLVLVGVCFQMPNATRQPGDPATNHNGARIVGFLLGAVAAGIYFFFMAEHKLYLTEDDVYVAAVLAGMGAVVTTATLAATLIPRPARSSGPRERRAPTAAILVTLILTTLLGVLTFVGK